MKPAVLALMEHMTTDQPIMSISVTDTGAHATGEEESEVVGQIKELIETR